ncbi:hypothetical protein [Bradyrhizobium sp. 6(2017)]|uniref:hypothetical protein n=1 Tax=Bradyrhizobium sp. 6(2017) TaxID=1197460 RepID=UPI0013E105A3|nr:hypothetical protein [Bradyrhizobium sp. 6(2017)]QIG92455.1 hypothetical protein G6P99_08005 [Bradyrhizobium sp. 6(2017)]
MNFEAALKRKLKLQGVEFVEATDATLIFKINGSSFSVPRPLNDGGWTTAQQELIANTLEYLGLEFWPLDFH